MRPASPATTLTLPSVGDSTIESGKSATDIGGKVRDVSVVMADLRGFTPFCERVAPELMSEVLNEYLTAMIDVILAHHGWVQDFIGDGILGIFGAPDDDPDHARHAVESALDMQSAIRTLNSRWQREYGISLALGVAVHTGEAFAGTVGSPRLCKYAVVGDLVNTAARLEELNRELGTEIVMTRDTLVRMEERVDAKPKGSFPVRGRSHEIDVFEVRGLRQAEPATEPFVFPQLAWA